jgi:hypothetical protein
MEQRTVEVKSKSRFVYGEAVESGAKSVDFCGEQKGNTA